MCGRSAAQHGPLAQVAAEHDDRVDRAERALQQAIGMELLEEFDDRDPVGSAAGEVPGWELFRRPSPKPDRTLSVSSGFPVTPSASTADGLPGGCGVLHCAYLPVGKPRDLS